VTQWGTGAIWGTGWIWGDGLIVSDSGIGADDIGLDADIALQEHNQNFWGDGHVWGTGVIWGIGEAREETLLSVGVAIQDSNVDSEETLQLAAAVSISDSGTGNDKASRSIPPVVNLQPREFTLKLHNEDVNA